MILAIPMIRELLLREQGPDTVMVDMDMMDTIILKQHHQHQHMIKDIAIMDMMSHMVRSTQNLKSVVDTHLHRSEVDTQLHRSEVDTHLHRSEVDTQLHMLEVDTQLHRLEVVISNKAMMNTAVDDSKNMKKKKKELDHDNTIDNTDRFRGQKMELALFNWKGVSSNCVSLGAAARVSIS